MTQLCACGCGTAVAKGRKYVDRSCQTRHRRVLAKAKADAPRKQAFLGALALVGVTTSACTHSGVPRATVYGWRAADAEFADAWDQALEDAWDRLEAEAHRRAVVGTLKPVFYKGEEVGVIREYSDQLLVELLRANRPRKFRANHKVEHSGTVALDWDEESQAFLEKLHAMGTGHGSGAQRLANALAEASAEAVVE